MSASSDSERTPQRQLGELMTELGLISEEQLATVLEVQQRSKRPLGQIIVELGFASGAAVAHALAMQSGGALRTEYGFALGIHPEHGDEDDESRAGLPKLRLAPTAVAPPVREYPDGEPPTEDEAQAPAEADSEPVEEPAAGAQLEAVPDLVEPAAEPAEAAVESETESETEFETEAEPAEAEVEVDESAEVEPVETEVEDGAEAEPVDAETVESLVEPEDTEPEAEESPVDWEEAFDEVEASANTPFALESGELTELRTEVERLEGVLTENQATAVVEQERLHAEVARLEIALAGETEREQELAALREEHERATSELERLQTARDETHSEHEEELARLRQERDHATTELEHRETELAELRERYSAEQNELSAQRDQLHGELGDALERLAAASSAVDERDRLHAEVERLDAAHAEIQTEAAAERERLLSDVERLESSFAAAQATHDEEMGRLRQEHEHVRVELDRLQTALAEAQTAAAEQERRLADEQKRRANERDELTAQRDRLHGELGDVLERLAVVAPAAEERDQLRVEVEQLRTESVETREACDAEIRRMAEERDTVTAELAEAREMLVQAERLRDSQIALTAERDRAIAELGRLQAVAAEAQDAAEEQARLLAEEQDRHRADVDSLRTQRIVLEQELGRAIEQLAAAASVADEREAQLQLGSQRLVEALDAVRRLAAELAPTGEELAGEELEPADPAPQNDFEARVADAETESDPSDTAPEQETVDYSLFVPGPNGYDLIPQTGVPPLPGETVEVVLPDRDEPTVFEVVRSGRTLPGGDVCVYLAQV